MGHRSRDKRSSLFGLMNNFYKIDTTAYPLKILRSKFTHTILKA